LELEKQTPPLVLLRPQVFRPLGLATDFRGQEQRLNPLQRQQAQRVAQGLVDRWGVKMARARQEKVVRVLVASGLAAVASEVGRVVRMDRLRVHRWTVAG
jgi:hypothetical protein